MKESDNKNLPQEFLFADMKDKNSEITSKRSTFFYVGIVLINVCMLLLFYGLVSNKYGVVSTSEIFESLDWRYLMFLGLSIVFVIFLQVMRDYVALFKMTKRRRFRGILFANQKYNLYGAVTTWGGEKSPYVVRLNKANIDKRSSVDMLYSKKFSELVSRVVYSVIVFVLGVIFCMNNANILMVILGVVAFLINGTILCILLYSFRNMDGCIGLIARVSKFLFRLKLVKDYEVFYKKMVSGMCEYRVVMKNLSPLSILSVLANMFTMFIRHFGLFVIFQMLNFGGWQYFVEILFYSTILDLIIGVLPLQKGTLVFELLFSVLFINVFFDGYLQIAMILYRIYDYFAYILISLLILLFDKKKTKPNNENEESISTELVD